MKCARSTLIVSDALIEDVKDASFSAIAIPGGMPGAENLGHHAELRRMMEKHARDGEFIIAGVVYFVYRT